MRKYLKRGPRRKTLTRLKFIHRLGFRRRRRKDARPFVVSVFRIERLALGGAA
jgi:hypothetical protein